jgi:hypothetical protein
MPHRTNLIPEDDARPEITETTVRVLEATGVQFTWDVRQAGIGAAREYGPFPRATRLDRYGCGGRISRDVDLPPKTMNGPPDRPCAETHSKERQ